LTNRAAALATDTFLKIAWVGPCTRIAVAHMARPGFHASSAIMAAAFSPIIIVGA